jgi:hypothetical protein
MKTEKNRPSVRLACHVGSRPLTRTSSIGRDVALMWNAASVIKVTSVVLKSNALVDEQTCWQSKRARDSNFRSALQNVR